MLSPFDLSEHPARSIVELPPYDFRQQQRHRSIEAGRHTSNSIQTFDPRGKPSDSKNDSND